MDSSQIRTPRFGDLCSPEKSPGAVEGKPTQQSEDLGVVSCPLTWSGPDGVLREARVSQRVKLPNGG